MKTKICPNCNGTQKAKCERCNGTGKWNGRGDNPCMPCNGTGEDRCYKCVGGKVKPDEPEYTITLWQEHQKIIAVVRTVYDAMKHTTRITKRFATAVEKSLPEGYHVIYTDEKYSAMIKIYGGILEYDDSLTLYMGSSYSWDKMKDEIERSDPSDYLERIEAEQDATITTDLIALDSEIARLQAAIAIKREIAANWIASLPIPKSATLRAQAYSWQEPSIYSRYTFTSIWPRKE